MGSKIDLSCFLECAIVLGTNLRNPNLFRNLCENSKSDFKTALFA